MDNHLLIMLDTNLVLRFIASDHSDPMIVGDREFHSIDWDGVFYDWLRNNNRQLIGVRLCDAPSAEVRSKLEALPYVSLSEYGMFCVYFGSDRSENCAFSCDQDFGENELYQAADGTLAFILDAYSLSEHDAAVIRSQSPVVHVA